MSKETTTVQLLYKSGYYNRVITSLSKLISLPSYRNESKKREPAIRILLFISCNYIMILLLFAYLMN